MPAEDQAIPILSSRSSPATGALHRRLRFEGGAQAHTADEAAPRRGRIALADPDANLLRNGQAINETPEGAPNP